MTLTHVIHLTYPMDVGLQPLTLPHPASEVRLWEWGMYVDITFYVMYLKNHSGLVPRFKIIEQISNCFSVEDTM